MICSLYSSCSPPQFDRYLPICAAYPHPLTGLLILWLGHRRMNYTEEKAKVIATSRETELLKFLAAVAIFHLVELKNGLICTMFFN